MRTILYSWVPLLQQLKNYQRESFISDLIAGIIVAAILVPQGMAYALLAGLPPEMGLYAGMVGTFIYGIFGQRASLSIGPTATICLLTASGIGLAADDPGRGELIQIAVTLAFMTGLITLAMSLLRMGFIFKYVNPEVVSGFVSASALIIALSQLSNLLGIDAPNSSRPHEMLIYNIQQIPNVHLLTLGFGLAGIGLLLYFKKGLGNTLKQVGMPPLLITLITRGGPLFVVILGIVLVNGFGLSNAGIRIVGEVPSGLPSLTAPSFDMSLWMNLLPSALIISLLAYTETVAIAYTFSKDEVNANRELGTLSLVNLATTFANGFPINASLSRSAVNHSTGARTGLSSIIASITVLLVLVFLTPLLYSFAKVLLSSIVFVSILGLVNWDRPRRVWIWSRGDSLAWLITFFAMLLFGLELGLLLGLSTSFGLLWCRRLGIKLPKREQDAEPKTDKYFSL